MPETILNKKGPLTHEEFGLIKKHPGFSASIIEPLKEFRDCVREVYHHHERIDGKGYPDGISGNHIPIGARVISVCDAFDAMASHRPYRPALPESVIHANLLGGRGKQLDGDVVDIFLKTKKG